jgi:hypothetical protein
MQDDGITIWKARRIRPATAGGTISIGLRRFLWMKQLVISGAAVAPVIGR